MGSSKLNKNFLFILLIHCPLPEIPSFTSFIRVLLAEGWFAALTARYAHPLTTSSLELPSQKATQVKNKQNKKVLRAKEF